jgi:hypothetical protein
MDTQGQARGTARQLVDLARDGDFDTVSGIVHVLTDPTLHQRELLRQVLTELLHAAAAMMVCQIGGLGPDSAIVLDLRKVDGSTVDIDELEPEVRAVVRALLAEINGHPEDTGDQVDLALAGDPRPLVDGVSLVLVWTLSAMAWCEDHDAPAPGWLTTTAV